MCYHKLYIFTGCGHAFSVPEPLFLCSAAQAAQSIHASTTTFTRTLRPRTNVNRGTSLAPLQTHKPMRSSSIYSTATAIGPAGSAPRGCTPLAHPYQSFRLPIQCADCQRQRSRLLSQAEKGLEVRFEDKKWKVSYRSPMSIEDTRTSADIERVASPVEKAGRNLAALIRVGLGESPSPRESRSSWIR